jgi:tRNA(Ile)-lysidine synthase
VGLEATAARTIRRHAMLAGGDVVLVAVSGGADSVALLSALLALAPSLGLALHVAHVDHGLRPDSGYDAGFVEALGRRLGVPVAVERVRVDVRGTSPEAAARAARYAALERVADRVGAGRIALGHTADDQAETVLMRLLERAGVRGLAGIPAVRGRFIRPLLDARRADVLAHLREAGLPWVEDPSNRDPKFLRNRIRHELLPLLAGAYGPDVVAALNGIAEQARETLDALDRMATAELARLVVTEPDALVLPLAALRDLPRGIAAEVLRQAAARLGGRAPLRAWGHRGLRRILAAPPPRRGFRLGGVVVEVSVGRVRLGRRPVPELPARELAVPGRLELPEIGRTIEATVVDGRGYAIPRTPDRTAFDAATLTGPLVVRARRRGDWFAAFGGGPRRLKSFLVTARVPRWDRRRVPVVETAGEIVWLAGLRRGAAAPVTPATARVVELRLVPLAQ